MRLKLSAGTGAALTWTKSSHSSNDSPDCVEVATTPGRVHVRDSKKTDGPRLAFEPGSWSAFVSHAVTR
ncbi:DUF397 domain-containing protein [Streptomyces reniochalinae]|uniref:DUF397 domain-containing protein n=1 Tax=Streptomyces reniochalinae TaxID=2250578 RepID=A0A367ENI9_9ACTN|nr:DUF397 domain-containing protein [Streptomyces reniochalinae]RCG19175.1 DUF397 domain-containing protein [Streptomyces reniochalinae]